MSVSVRASYFPAQEALESGCRLARPWRKQDRTPKYTADRVMRQSQGEKGFGGSEEGEDRC